MNNANSIFYKPHSISSRQENSCIYLTSNYPLEPPVSKVGEWVDCWAEKTPENIFMRQRQGVSWQSVSYQELLQLTNTLARSLLDMGLHYGSPILIVAPNSINHALLSLAGQLIGAPVSPVAVQYAQYETAQLQLTHILQLIEPQLIYLAKPNEHAVSLIETVVPQARLVVDNPLSASQTGFDSLLQPRPDTADLAQAKERVHADTVAKILLTSGSSSSPKGVITTHRMMCTNQSQMASVLPFVKKKLPVILDWLPWNHVFGGNHNFNMMLANGGCLYIDDGKPIPGLIERSIENHLMVEPTIAFNVPLGYAMLLDHFSHNEMLAHQFFAKLHMVIYAGASLPKTTWQGLETMAKRYASQKLLITSSWGMTETAPACILQHQFTDRTGVVGVPLPGVSVKLIPDEDNPERYEIRVKGDNVMPGYYKDEKKNQESIDTEGYFITGDTMRFVDPDKHDQGLQFDGRLGEHFKLITGTWVDAPGLRLQMLDLLGEYATDVIITGENQHEIGMMVVPDISSINALGMALEQRGQVFYNSDLYAKITQLLQKHNVRAKGGSKQIKRTIILATLPSFASGEVTAKGNINFKKFLNNHAALLEKLHKKNCDIPVIVS